MRRRQSHRACSLCCPERHSAAIRAVQVMPPCLVHYPALRCGTSRGGWSITRLLAVAAVATLPIGETRLATG